MTRILLATHGGRSADGAARIASQLATRSGASLDVLVVVEPFPPGSAPPLDAGFGMGIVPVPRELEGIGETLRMGVTAQLGRCGADHATPRVRTGPVAQEIADAARTGAADLVVIGLGAHGVVDRALGGETALQLVQIAGAPVLAVPADYADLPRRAIAAIDFTATSVRAAKAAAECLVAGDVLDLVHVRPPPASGTRGGGNGSSLRDLASRLVVPPGVEVVAVELHGDAAPSLLAYLDGSGADLIALGSHGYGWWKRLTLGSVASKVLRLATRAVLVAPLGSVSVPG